MKSPRIFSRIATTRIGTHWWVPYVVDPSHREGSLGCIEESPRRCSSGTSWVCHFFFGARNICTTRFSHPILVRRNRHLSWQRQHRDVKNYIQTKIELTLGQPCVWRPGTSRNLITLIPSPKRLLNSMMTVSRALTPRGACKVLKLARVTLKDSQISSIMPITKEHVTYFSPSRRHCAT